MIVFINGKPCKKEYRHFKIKELYEQDDYGAMVEMLKRRINRLSDKKFGSRPDLILIDGGKGHLRKIQNLFDELKVNIKIGAMKKDNKHRTKTLIVGDNEHDLFKYDELFRLITRIQDEVHRYTIEYNRKTRKKRNIKSELDNIYGIGGKKKKALIKYFGSFSVIKNAKKEELLKVEGISDKLADEIISYFKKGI